MKSSSDQSELIVLKYDPSTSQSSIGGVQNAEYLLRMHFLQQAMDIVKDPSLQRLYASEMKNIAKRNVLRTDPEIKKKFCKRCNTKIDELMEYHKLKGKGKNKYSLVECPFCLFRNKIYGAFSSSVTIKDSINSDQPQQQNV